MLSFAQGVSLLFEQQLHCYYLVAFKIKLWLLDKNVDKVSTNNWKKIVKTQRFFGNFHFTRKTRENIVCSARNFCYFWKIFCNGFGELPGSGFLSCVLQWFELRQQTHSWIHGTLGWKGANHINQKNTWQISLVVFYEENGTSMKGIKVDPLPLFTVITQNICYAYSWYIC